MISQLIYYLTCGIARTFGTCRTFSREITTAKLGITAGERCVALNIIQKLAYATSEEQYLDLYDQLKQCAPQSVITYFDTN